MSDTIFGANAYIPLGARTSGSARMQRYDGVAQYGAGMVRRADAQNKGWSWRFDAIREAQASVQAAGGRRFDHTRLDLAARLGGASSSFGLRADGAVVLAGGGAFLSNRIDDSFAVVDTGAPEVEVRLENRPVGTTGRSGKVLVPDLRSYEAQTISIDAQALPIWPRHTVSGRMSSNDKYSAAGLEDVY